MLDVADGARPTEVERLLGHSASTSSVDASYGKEERFQERFPDGIALEDFKRLADCLEMRISRAYWNRRGNQAFTTREVPNDVTNDGVRAFRAAEVLFANCIEAKQAGSLGDSIEVVEIGVGLGLFARLFLLHFERLCNRDGQDFHRHLVYHATDLSKQNLADIQRLGTLSEYGATVRLGILDAMDPSVVIPFGCDRKQSLQGGVRAVFHNYLYDVLHHSLVLRQHGVWYELRVQTRLAEPWRVQEFSAQSFYELMTSVRCQDSEAGDVLADIHPLIDVERAYFPIAAEELPYHQLIEHFADKVLQPEADRMPGENHGIRLWLPTGAMVNLEKTAELLAPDGFVLFSDYGHTTVAEVMTARAYQSYGAGICAPVNFLLLDQFAQHLGLECTALEGDETLSLHARLITRSPLPQTQSQFRVWFGADQFHELERRLAGARETVEADVLAAVAAFRETDAMFSDNWMLLAEWAHVENFYAENPKAALSLVDRALALNPSCSADLWCERGDALLRLNGGSEAGEEAYLRGIWINPEHVRSYLSLAGMHSDRGAHGDALQAMARAFVCDREGHHTQILLEKQQEILDRRAAVSEADNQRLMLRTF